MPDREQVVVENGALPQRALEAARQGGDAFATGVARETAPLAVRHRRRRLFILFAAAFWATFAGMTYVVRALEPRSWEIGLTHRLQATRWPPAVFLLNHVSALGFAPLNHALVIATTAILWLARLRAEALLTLSTWGAGLIVGAIKLMMERPRPTEPLARVPVKLKDYSYPSGHVVHYVTFYGFLFYLAYTMLRASPLRSAVLALTAALALLVGPSRVFRGEHWPGDVLGSYSFGLGYLILQTVAHQMRREGRR